MLFLNKIINKIFYLKKKLQRAVSSFVATIYYENKHIKKSKLSNIVDDTIIISLTTTPERCSKVHLVIKSLLLQKIRAFKICLYIGDDFSDFSFPKKLLDLQNFNFEITQVKDDIKPHKKYFYAMQSFPNKNIITVDDDVIYDKNMTNRLIKAHHKYPKCACANRAHLIQSKNGELLPYKNWERESSITTPSLKLISTGCAGVLYPANILPKETFNLDDIKKYSLLADDIWLKFMELKTNIPIVCTGKRNQMPITILGSQKKGLFKSNLDNNKNDEYIKNMTTYTGINLLDYSEKV